MTIDGYQIAFGAADITSGEMKRAIEQWFRLYYQREATAQADPCLQIPYTIVRKLTKTVFSEHWTASDDPFAKGILTALEKKQAHLYLRRRQDSLKWLAACWDFLWRTFLRPFCLLH